MPSEIEKRYRQYLDYARITTARLSRSSAARPKGVSLQLAAPSMAEFSEWWNRISAEPQTLARWTERLDAPEEFFERTRVEIRACLESLPLAPAA